MKFLKALANMFLPSGGIVHKNIGHHEPPSVLPPSPPPPPRQFTRGSVSVPAASYVPPIRPPRQFNSECMFSCCNRRQKELSVKEKLEILKQLEGMWADKDDGYWDDK